MRNADQVAGMLCPVCKVPLALSDRQGIEIDYCPQCRGVWLDRGELDKIIERDAAQSQPGQQPAPQAAPQPAPPPQQPQQPYPQQGYPPQGGYPPQPGYGYHDQKYYKHKRKKHWLEEIFD